MAEAQAEDDGADEEAPEEAQEGAEPETQEGTSGDEPAEDEPEADDAPDEAEEGGLSEDERRMERLKTEAIQQVVDVGFPLTRDAALEYAGHREVEVGDATLTVNMILSKLRGDDWRTGTDFRNAVERAWDDIKESYI